jgi:hypothetical protein
VAGFSSNRRDAVRRNGVGRASPTGDDIHLGAVRIGVGQSAVRRISSTRPPQAHCSAQRRHDGCHRVEPPRHSRDRGGASRAPRVPRRRRRSRRVRLVLGRAGAIFRQALREARGGGWRRRAPRARVPPFSRAPRARARTHLGGTSARASVSSPRPRGVRAAPRRHAGHRYPSPIIRGAPCAFFFASSRTPSRTNDADRAGASRASHPPRF